MLPLLLGLGIAAVALLAVRKQQENAPRGGGYPSGYELHGYNETLKMTDAPHPFASLAEAKAYGDKLLARGGFKVAIRYVPPGYVPNDPRSEAATTLQFAQPANYNPWREKKSPR